MTGLVEFHTGVADPIGFACRLLRKAYRQGSGVVVTGTPATIDSLDRALWTFAAQEFIPHVKVAESSEAVLGRTPIWLAASTTVPSGGPDVLVNIDGEAPAREAAFVRIIEIVGDSELAVAEGRTRWRHYESWGVQPVHHRAQ